MTRANRLRHLLPATLLCLAPLASAQEAPVDDAAVLPGVVIEEVEPGSALEKAGLQPGDIITAWERLASPPANPEAARGEIVTVFDWMWLEFEQAPRGTVVLTGTRGGEERSFEVSMGLWKAKVRPRLPTPQLTAYKRGSELLTEGRTQAATDIWRKAATDLTHKPTRSWMFLRIAEAWDVPWNLAKNQASYTEALRAEPHAVSRALIWRLRGRAYLESESHNKALEAFGTAREILESTPNTQLNLARIHRRLAAAARALGRMREHSRHTELSLAIVSEHAPQSLDHAASLLDYGNIALNRQSDFLTARQYYDSALVIQEQLAPENTLLSDTLNNLGLANELLGEVARAREHYQRSWKIRQRLDPISRGAVRPLINLSTLERSEGNLDLAKEYLHQALRISHQLNPKGMQAAKCLNNLANIARIQGDLNTARSHAQRAIEISTTVAPDSEATAIHWNLLGSIAFHQGDSDRALEFFKRSLDIRERNNPRSPGVASVLLDLGSLALKRADFGVANRHFHRALEIERSSEGINLNEAYALIRIGEIHFLQSDLDQAQEYIRQGLVIALRLAPNSLDVAISLNRLGRLAMKRDDVKSAIQYFQESLLIIQKTVPESTHSANYLYDLATALRRQGRPEKALKFFLESLEGIEAQVGRLGSSRSRQALFRAQNAAFYYDTIETSLSLEQTEEAFHLVERFRARSLLNQLAERDLIFSASIPKELDQRRRRLAVQLDRTQGRLQNLNARDHTEEIDAIREKLRQLSYEAEELEQEIRNVSPHMASLHFPEPLTLERARKHLDPGTLLLTFSVGENGAYLFATSAEIPLYVATLPAGGEELARRIEQFRDLVESTTSGSRRFPKLQELSRNLYATLLLPVADQIAQAKRLLILPDGPLYYLPWAALLRPTADGGEEYLIEQLPIHVSVSATVYAELQKQRRPAEVDGLQVAAFGDPLFPGAGEAVQRHDDVVVRSVGERGIFDWQPLPHSRREVEGIADLYPDAATAYLGEAATEERVKGLARDTRIVHFATHGHVDERFPMNSFLALTIPERPGEGQDNGLLQVWEIYESLRLDADLVVLSACESAIGEEVRSEGLMGLTRAFHYAGARSVMATLWSIEDASTAELMVRFHRHLRDGKTKDEALRAAQLELVRSPLVTADGELLDATAPRSWAAFQLYGDWR